MVISGSRRLPMWAWGVCLALVSSAISGVLFLLATDGDLSQIFHVERLVSHAAQNAELFRWAMILDMLGYYVLLAPLFVAVAGDCTTSASRGRRCGRSVPSCTSRPDRWPRWRSPMASRPSSAATPKLPAHSKRGS
jgi:hypothetical protein